MENITLRQYLATLDPETPIAIGTDSLGGFLFFGFPNETEVIEKIFAKYRKAIEGRLERSKHKTNRKASSLSLETIENYSDYIKTYSGPMDRMVVDIYGKDIDDCKAIIIQGMESGKYWFKEEYDNKKAPTGVYKPKEKKAAPPHKEKKKYMEFPKGILEVEEYKRLHPEQEVVYFCDGKGCDLGRRYGFCLSGECFHTSNPNHAFNKDEASTLYFYEPIPGKWMECTRATAKGG